MEGAGQGADGCLDAPRRPSPPATLARPRPGRHARGRLRVHTPPGGSPARLPDAARAHAHSTPTPWPYRAERGPALGLGGTAAGRRGGEGRGTSCARTGAASSASRRAASCAPHAARLAPSALSPALLASVRASPCPYSPSVSTHAPTPARTHSPRGCPPAAPRPLRAHLPRPAHRVRVRICANECTSIPWCTCVCICMHMNGARHGAISSEWYPPTM